MLDLTVNLVDSVPEAERFLSWLGERRPVLGLDTETSGLEWDAEVRLVQFGDARSAWAIPPRLWRGVAEEALRLVRDSGEPVVLHNAGFDMHRLTNNGYPVPAWAQVHDTLLMSRLVWPHLPAGLKPVCKRLLGPEAVAGQAMLTEEMRKNRWTWATVPDTLPAYWTYGALDTSLTAIAYEAALPQVPGPAYEREMAVLAILHRAESRGMAIDLDYTADLLASWREEAASLRADLEAAGIANPGSNPEVERNLRAAGWQPEEFTETGQAKLDKAVLNALRQVYPAVAEPLLRYRRLTKWCSTYLEPFLRSDGRVHPNINTFGAKTGRMSITDPPLQTLPSGEASIRNCVVPYSDDEVLYAIDYSNMEMRIFAAYTGDPALIQAARSEDFHRSTAALVFDKPEAEVSGEERKLAKGANFGNVFMGGPDTIAAQVGIDRQVVVDFLAKFEGRFPSSKRFKDEVVLQGKRRAAVDGEAWITTCGGRKAVTDGDGAYRLVNYICQGGAADVFKAALVALDAEGLADYVVCPVHDELLFSFPKESAQELAERARVAMEDHHTFSVPLVCDVDGPLPRWGAKYERNTP